MKYFPMHACERAQSLMVHTKHTYLERWVWARVSILRTSPRCRFLYICVCVFLIALPTPSLREIKRENPLSGVRLDLFSPFASLIPTNVDCAVLRLRLRGVWNYYVHAFAMSVFMANSLLGRITLVINYFKLSNHSEDNFSKLSVHGVIRIILHRERPNFLSQLIEVKDFPVRS
jgi:hypothetical protein